MLKSIRNSLTTTVVAITPFLLTACGDDGDGQKKNSLFLISGLLFAVFMIRELAAVKPVATQA